MAVIYDEMVRKHMTEMAEKNDPELELNGKNIGKIDKLVLEKAHKEYAERDRAPKGGGKGGERQENPGQPARHWGNEGKQQHGKGYGKNKGGKGHHDNRGEKRALPWQKPYSEHKKWRSGGGDDYRHQPESPVSDQIAEKASHTKPEQEHANQITEE